MLGYAIDEAVTRAKVTKEIVSMRAALAQDATVGKIGARRCSARLLAAITITHPDAPRTFRGAI